jgi:hypothetical protein
MSFSQPDRRSFYTKIGALAILLMKTYCRKVSLFGMIRIASEFELARGGVSQIRHGGTLFRRLFTCFDRRARHLIGGVTADCYAFAAASFPTIACKCKSWPTACNEATARRYLGRCQLAVAYRLQI